MTTELSKDILENHPYELRLVLDELVGGPGQYDEVHKNPMFYIPLAGASCQVVLAFKDKRISSIKRGPALDEKKWGSICKQIEARIRSGRSKFGREFSFSSFRVQGSWRGDCSHVQIMPAPEDAPSAPLEIAAHPFILEFPLVESDSLSITNDRWRRGHRKLTLLLNILLAGHTHVAPQNANHFWAWIFREDGQTECKWVQNSFFGKLGDRVISSLSPRSEQTLDELKADAYYTSVGHDGQGLRVPNDLDELICCYQGLSISNSAKFDRAAYWFEMAAQQWDSCHSSSFRSLVSAIEALTERGIKHTVYCDKCKRKCSHDSPGATENFRAFFDKYSADASLSPRRTMMYEVRSNIVHGGDLMQIDEDKYFGWDPPGSNELDLHRELFSLTRIALRNWLKNPN